MVPFCIVQNARNGRVWLMNMGSSIHMATAEERQVTNEEHHKLRILAAARELGAGWYIEERLAEDVNHLLWLLGLVAMNMTLRETSEYKRGESKNTIGRPRKLRSELKPVQLHLQVKRLQEFFEKNERINLSQRDAIKLLIKYNEIPQNSELNHVEKQVSAGKKAIDRMRKELNDSRQSL